MRRLQSSAHNGITPFCTANYRPHKSFFHVPNEIVARIGTHLSPIDQGTWQLVAKHVYNNVPHWTDALNTPWEGYVGTRFDNQCQGTLIQRWRLFGDKWHGADQYGQKLIARKQLAMNAQSWNKEVFRCRVHRYGDVRNRTHKVLLTCLEPSDVVSPIMERERAVWRKSTLEVDEKRRQSRNAGNLRPEAMILPVVIQNDPEPEPEPEPNLWAQEEGRGGLNMRNLHADFDGAGPVAAQGPLLNDESAEYVVHKPLLPLTNCWEQRTPQQFPGGIRCVGRHDPLSMDLYRELNCDHHHFQSVANYVDWRMAKACGIHDWWRKLQHCYYFQVEGLRHEYMRVDCEDVYRFIRSDLWRSLSKAASKMLLASPELADTLKAWNGAYILYMDDDKLYGTGNALFIRDTAAPFAGLNLWGPVLMLKASKMAAKDRRRARQS